MKKIIIALIIIIAIIIAIFSYTWIQPEEYTVTKSRVIDKPVNFVFLMFNDYKYWKKWSAWFQADISMKIKYSEPSLGIGARQTWQSEYSGNGYQVTRHYEHNKKLTHQLVYTKPYKGGAMADILFDSLDNQKTRVTWSIKSKNNSFIEKLFYWTVIKGDIEDKIEESFENIGKL